MVLAASGKLDHDRVVDLADGALRATCRRRPTAAAAEPARYTGGEYREDRDLDQVHLVLGFPGVAVRRPRLLRRTRCSRPLLGGGMSSRLFQEVREKRGLVYFDPLLLRAPTADGGLFGIYAGTGAEEAGELVPVMCDELCKVADGRHRDELAAPTRSSRPAC